MKHPFTYILLVSLLTACSTVPSSDRDTIRSLDDLDGKSLIVQSGSVQDMFASQNCKDSKLMRVEKTTDTFAVLEIGKAQASLVSDIVWMMSKDNFHNIVEVCDSIAPQPIGLVFNKSNGALREKFNEFLLDYIADNDIRAINDEWMNPESPRRMPSPDEVKNPVGTMRFAVSADTPPFGFVKNGEVSGSEVEILARFAMSRNMRWEFMDVSFTGLINCIQSGKADIGASIICITEERKQSVDFSIPWMAESSVLLVHRDYAPEELLTDADGGAGHDFWSSIRKSIHKSLVQEDRYLLLWKGFNATLLIVLLSGLLGTLLGIFLCFCSVHRNPVLSKGSDIFSSIIGFMPQVVFLMIMFYVVFGKSDINGIWVASIAFALCFGAGTSVVFKTALQSIDRGQTEAALSLGFSKFKSFVNVILPQTVQRALPVYKGEFVSLIKSTSIVGYIAVLDVTKAGDIIRSRTYEALFPLILVTIVYFVIIQVVTVILKRIETGTRPTRKKFFK